jgi:hypothetical protein
MLAQSLHLLTADAEKEYLRAHTALEADDSGPTRAHRTRAGIRRALGNVWDGAQSVLRRVRLHLR